MAEARGGYVAFLDDDDVWEADKPRRQIDFMEKTKSPFVFSDFCNFAGRVSPESGPSYFQRLDVVFDKEELFAGEQRHLEYLQKNFIHPSVMMMTREFCAASRIWDDDSWLGREAYEYFTRRFHLMTLGVMNEVMVYRRIRGNNTTNNWRLYNELTVDICRKALAYDGMDAQCRNFFTSELKKSHFHLFKYHLAKLIKGVGSY